MINDVREGLRRGSVVTQWRFSKAVNLKGQRQFRRNAGYWMMAEIQTKLFH